MKKKKKKVGLSFEYTIYGYIGKDLKIWKKICLNTRDLPLASFFH